MFVVLTIGPLAAFLWLAAVAADWLEGSKQ